jgi:hypothetical protein
LLHWQDYYQDRTCTAQEAVKVIKPGDFVVVAHACGEPQTLTRAMSERYEELKDVKVVHRVGMGECLYAQPGMEEHFRHISLFAGVNTRQAIYEGRADFLSRFISETPSLFLEGHIPVDVALITVSPPDKNGYCSLGISVDYTLPAAQMAEKFDTPIKTVALIYENTSWGQGAVRAWEKYIPEAGLEIVLKEPYPSNSSDLTPVVLKCKNLNPDIIMLVSYVSDAALLTNTFAEHKVMPKAFVGTSGGFADPAYFELTGDNCEYYFDISTWEPDVNRPFSQEVNQKFTEKYGYAMNAEAVKAYASMYIIADALERAGSTDPEALRQAFAETNITEGPTQMYASEIVFDETGQMVNAPLVISQMRKIDGKMERVSVWPEAEARPGMEIVWPYPGVGQ